MIITAQSKITYAIAGTGGAVSGVSTQLPGESVGGHWVLEHTFLSIGEWGAVVATLLVILRAYWDWRRNR